jgi:DNA-binding transcriptional regulator YhcF (GntR family)
LRTLATDPLLTVESTSTRLAVSPAAAHRALTELADADVLKRNNYKGRLVCWSADRHLALVAPTEHSRVAPDTVAPPLSRRPKAMMEHDHGEDA